MCNKGLLCGSECLHRGSWARALQGFSISAGLRVFSKQLSVVQYERGGLRFPQSVSQRWLTEDKEPFYSCLTSEQKSRA